MKYFRLSYLSAHRMGGSTYANPKFVLQLPENSVSDVRSGKVKVVLEHFDGYASKQSSKAYDEIFLRFSNIFSQNGLQTLGPNDFGPSNGIDVIKADRRGSSEIYYHFENRNANAEKGLIVPSSSFNFNIIEFNLTHSDGTEIASPSAPFNNYLISLGIYVEEEHDCKCLQAK